MIPGGTPAGGRGAGEEGERGHRVGATCCVVFYFPKTERIEKPANTVLCAESACLLQVKHVKRHVNSSIRGMLSFIGT